MTSKYTQKRFHGDGLPGRFPDEAKEIAELNGDVTYRGKEHIVCGTNERYTKNSACVYCLRRKQKALRTEERAARKAGQLDNGEAPKLDGNPWD